MIRRIVAGTTILLALIGASRTSIYPKAANAAADVRPDSARRGGLSPLDSLKSLEKLAADITALANLPTEVKAGKVGIEIKSLGTGKILYSMNADKPLTPASNTKVVTAFTALSDLGPNYLVRTVAASDVRPQGGVLKGNLYVKGFGDPFLSINEIDQITDQIVNAGIRQIEGSLVGDGTFFDNKTERTQYSGDADQVEALPPIQALTIERGTFTVVVSSPRTPGMPCNVQTFPHSAGFAIINNATSSSAPARGGRKRADLAPVDGVAPFQRYGDAWPDADHQTVEQRRPAKKTPPASAPKRGSAAAKAPAKGKAKGAPAKKPVKGVATVRKAPTREQPATTQSAPQPTGRGPLKVSISTNEDGRQVITVNGSLAPNRTVSYRYQMKNPPLVIAGMLYDRLRSHGITITGGVVAGQAPPKSRVIAEAGRPLIDILHLVMKNSNNFLAEYVFKMIGAAAGGQQETAQKSVERIEQRMSLNRVPFGSCIINDGSGLSRANCLSAAALIGILEAAHENKKMFDPFYRVMSIAGVDGTLRKRMKGTFAEGNVHGKTGTLNNVSALCGYVTTRDGELLCFAMLMNGGNHGSYRTVQDKIAARLASFSYTQPVLSPAPPQKAPSASGSPSASRP